MANSGDFQEQVKKLGRLITEFDRLPDGPTKDAGREMVRLLMEVHGAGIERMMETIFDSSETGPSIIDKLGADSVTGSLLLLYSLHPDDIETRVHRAMENMRPRLRKLACTGELVSIDEGAVTVRLETTGHSCGSSTKDLYAIVEECVYELAPDVASLDIVGLEEPTPNGFVALESLLGHSLVASAPRGNTLQPDGGD